MTAATDPERFGWRFWLISDTYGQLMTPWANQDELVDLNMSDPIFSNPKPAVTATCTGGHPVPSPFCTCGIHYCPGAETFFQALNGGFLNKTVDRELVAVAFGVAGGGVMFDPKNGDWGGIRPRRASSFHVLGLMLPETSSWQQAFEDRYNIPVIKGVDLEAAKALERTALATLFMTTTDEELDILMDDHTTIEVLAAYMREQSVIVKDLLDMMTTHHAGMLDLESRLKALEGAE
ncbi:hypothetical protein [Williamsia herbipolensis]|uniref:hypothetical protein n=1 Tax=Williamsia herbipolensis TaxID=1603258 RepID=UPI0005F812FE|nr:hypothetical protein [Williamsia herbipolensis]